MEVLLLPLPKEALLLLGEASGLGVMSRVSALGAALANLAACNWSGLMDCSALDWYDSCETQISS